MVAHLVIVSFSIEVEMDVTVIKTVVVIPPTLVLVLVPPTELPTKLLPLWSLSPLSLPSPPNPPSGPKPRPKPVSVGAGASSDDVEDVLITGMTTSDSPADDEEDE